MSSIQYYIASYNGFESVAGGLLTYYMIMDQLPADATRISVMVGVGIWLASIVKVNLVDKYTNIFVA